MNDQVLIATLFAYSAFFGAIAVHDGSDLYVFVICAVSKAIVVSSNLDPNRTTQPRTVIALGFRFITFINNLTH